MTIDDRLGSTELAGRLTWAIGTGGIPTGDRLPSLRKGARQWGTSVHVVREAYRRLAEAGLIAIQPGSVARVVQAPAPDRAALDLQVRRFVREVATTHRVSPAEVLSAVERHVHEALPTVTVVECSTTLAASIGRQLRRRWRVRTALHRLGDGTVPDGTLLSTWFHRAELRPAGRRPGCTVTFVRLHPSTETATLVARWASLRPDAPVTLLETDPALAANVVRMLGQAVPEATIATQVTAAGEETLRHLDATRGGFVLVSPRHWDELGDDQHLRPGVALLDYRVAPEDLAALGVAQEWTAARGESSSGN